MTSLDYSHFSLCHYVRCEVFDFVQKKPNCVMSVTVRKLSNATENISCIWYCWRHKNKLCYRPAGRGLCSML